MDQQTLAGRLATPRRPRSRWGLIWRRYLNHKPAFVSIFVLAMLVMLAVFSPWINELVLGVRADEIDTDKRFLGHTVGNWLGTDQYGRDLLARLLEGARVSLSVGISVVLIGSTVGLIYGLIAAYAGGIIDNAMMRLVDTLLAIPTFYIILALAAMKRVSLFEVILFIALTSWMGTARLVRAEVLSLKEREYVVAASALGASALRTMVRHILPGVMPVVIVAATLGVGSAILTESSLSFLGVGIQEPLSSWGSLLTNAASYVIRAQHLAIYPGLMIMVTVLTFNFVGEGLREALDPRFY
jgi:peptide/nickel transport system permease protein